MQHTAKSFWQLSLLCIARPVQAMHPRCVVRHASPAYQRLCFSQDSGRASSPAASPQGSSTNGPTLRQHSPVHHTHTSTSASPTPRSSTPQEAHTHSPQQQGDASHQQESPDAASSSGLNVQPATQHAQRAGQGQGSGKQPSHARTHSQYPGAAQQRLPLGMV